MSKKFVNICAIFIVIILFAHLAHFYFCSKSILPEFTLEQSRTDMNANYRWAQSILDQGITNPSPYHPYMKEIAPYETWVKWWKGEEIYQQSPLYAYLMALSLKLTGSLLPMHLLNVFLGFFLCVLIGICSYLVTENKKISLIAFILAGTYAPFYAYSWPLLRDLIGWILLLLFAIFMSLWQKASTHPSEKTDLKIAFALGLTLGIGLLARETFYLIIPVSLVFIGVIAHKKKDYRFIGGVVLALFLSLSPLLIRNALVGAPLFSSSNRFSETFIQFNAPSALIGHFSIPSELPEIMEKSEGKPLIVVKNTLLAYDNPFLWLKKVPQKLLNLLAPYESPDNQCIYYLELISPMVAWGSPHWFIVIPGLCGLGLSLYRRDTKHLWLWFLASILLFNIALFTPTSRYRQSLAMLWVIWAAYYFYAIYKNGWTPLGRSQILLLILGWVLCLGVFDTNPTSPYYRKNEFYAAARIYVKRGDYNKAQDEIRLFYSLKNVHPKWPLPSFVYPPVKEKETNN